MLAVYLRIQKTLSYYEKYIPLKYMYFLTAAKMKNNSEKIECGVIKA